MRMFNKPPTDAEIARWDEFQRLCGQVPEDDDKDARLRRIAGMCKCAYQTARLWHSAMQREELKLKYYPPSKIVLGAFEANLELAKMKGEL